MARLQSAERVSHRDESDNYVFQRSLLAYHKAAGIVSGNVLEIGTGSGYGISVISPKAKKFVTIDKADPAMDLTDYPNVEFIRMKAPPLTAIPAEAFDYVIMFQVIEHIRDDIDMLQEIHRVLRPGGKLVITTPNAKMSLTRNPWHVREYTCEQFRNMLSCVFSGVEALGIYGRENVMEYYASNRKSVERIARYDILRMRDWLPRWLLRIPYDILNRRNRRRLLDADHGLVAGIKMDDYFFGEAGDEAFDLFYIATK